MKVERPRARLSLAPMRVKMRSTRPSAPLRRDEAADLRHQTMQRGLAQIGALAAHVGAGDEHDDRPRRRAGEQIVGNEAARASSSGFDDRVAAGDDSRTPARRRSRTNVAVVGGDAPRAGEQVELGDARAWRGMRRRVAHARAQLREELVLDLAGCARRASRICASYSLSSGVMNRSALTRVCLRRSRRGRWCRFGLVISM